MEEVRQDEEEESTETWLQEIIAWFGARGIPKRELLEHYYPDEIIDIMQSDRRQKGADYQMLFRIRMAPHLEEGDRRRLEEDINNMVTGQKEGRYSFLDEKANRQALSGLKQELRKRKEKRTG